MNAEITLLFKNKIIKEKKNRETGELEQELLIQGEQKINLPDGQIRFDSFDVPLNMSMDKHYTDKKYGDVIKVPCSIYAKAVNEKYATLGIGKVK